MSIFGADYNPTPVERLREGAGWLLALVFAVGFVWLTSWLDNMGKPPVDMGFWLLPLLLISLMINRLPVNSWLEAGRSRKPGQWRTTRAARIAVCCSALFLAGYGFSLPLQARQAWALGDMPRFAGAAIGTVVWLAVVLVVVLRRARTRLELAIDDVGVFASEWRGVVPWGDAAYGVRRPRSLERRLSRPWSSPLSLGRCGSARTRRHRHRRGRPLTSMRIRTDGIHGPICYVYEIILGYTSCAPTSSSMML